MIIKYGQSGPAPQGRPTLAQRFSAGKPRKNDPSPGGTADLPVGDMVREEISQ